MSNVRQVKVIAHRGASGYLPEHTQEAKTMAFAMGADYLEQDVVLARDAIPLVLHDVHLDTVTDVATKFPGRSRANGRFYAIDFTFNEIQTLRVTERFHHQTGLPVYPDRFPVRTGTFRLSALHEELELIRGLNHSTGRNIGIYPELKHPKFHHDEGYDLGCTVLEVLTKYGYQNREDNCLLQCFEADELRRLRQTENCQLTMVQLLSDEPWMRGKANQELRTQKLSEIAQYAQAIGPAVDGVFQSNPTGGRPLPTELVVDAHRQQLLIHPWTYRADDLPQLFETFADLHYATLEAGIDGIFTDFPDLSVQLLSVTEIPTDD